MTRLLDMAGTRASAARCVVLAAAVACAPAAAAVGCAPAKRETSPATARPPAGGSPAASSTPAADAPRPQIFVEVATLPGDTAPRDRPGRSRPLPPPVPAYILQPPTWMQELERLPDDVDLVDVRTLALSSPAAKGPNVPLAPRPPAMGEPLRLAELALDRGDPFDAAAQLRPLLARASAEDRPYLELQLCRAYVALGRLDEAQALLERAIARGTPTSWPAVFELATLLVRHRGDDAYDTWIRLSPHARAVDEDLARHLQTVTADATVLAKLDTVIAQPRSALQPCLRELTAFETKPPHGLPSWRVCPVHRRPPARVPRSATEKRQLRHVAMFVSHWPSLMRRRPSDPDRWLLVAHQFADTVQLDPSTPAAVLASWLALLAYQNAANIAADRGAPYVVTREYFTFARSHVERMHPAFRDEIRRVADSFMQVTP